MNRILHLVGKSCPCERAKQHAEKLDEVARSIESVAGGLVEVVAPLVSDCLDGHRGLRARVAWVSDEIPIGNAAADLAAELQGLAESLLTAADELLKGGAR